MRTRRSPQALTAKLMVDWLKETEMATRLETVIARVIAEDKVRTYDMGGKASKCDRCKEILSRADFEAVALLCSRLCLQLFGFCRHVVVFLYFGDPMRSIRVGEPTRRRFGSDRKLGY